MSWHPHCGYGCSYCVPPKKWSQYKISIGYCLWDNGCGVLQDLEETSSWQEAVRQARTAEGLIYIAQWQADLGVAIGWCGRTEPVILRQL